MFSFLPLSHQRPNPAPWCLTASTWSCRPPWTTAPTSCWRPQFGPLGATVSARAGPTATPGRVAGRVWPAGPSASWRGSYRVRTVGTATGIGAGTGRWAATGAARSSAKNPAPATTSVHCEAHTYTQERKSSPTQVHTPEWWTWGRMQCKKNGQVEACGDQSWRRLVWLER